jgi:hypothetical protein
MMHSFQINESRWPIVLVTFPAVVTLDEYRELFHKYAELSKRGDRIGYHIDMRLFNPLMAPAAIRKGAAEVFAQNREVLIEATACEARVVASSLTSGILTAFDWLTGQKWPCANFTSMDEAARWIEGHVRKVDARPVAHA